MYGFPNDLEMDDIVGAEIQQICLGRADVQFRFGTGRVICAQALVEVFRCDELVSTWDEESNWSNSRFQILLDVAIDGYTVLHERLLEVRLKGCLKLHFHDTSDRFESLQIYPEMIIV